MVRQLQFPQIYGIIYGNFIRQFIQTILSLNKTRLVHLLAICRQATTGRACLFLFLEENHVSIKK